MVRTLGVHFASSALFLALVEKGVILDANPQKIDVPEHLSTTKSVVRFRDDVGRRLAECGAHRGAILQPSSYAGGISAETCRLGAETLLRLVAGDLEIDVILLNRNTARAKLGVPRAGDLAGLVAGAVGPPVGSHWTHRRYAAFAALARDKMP